MFIQYFAASVLELHNKGSPREMLSRGACRQSPLKIRICPAERGCLVPVSQWCCESPSPGYELKNTVGNAASPPLGLTQGTDVHASSRRP